jgi:hypothetical protein
MPAAGPRRRRPHGVGGRTLRGGSHLTEVQARAALRAFQAVGDIEQWIAEQWWEPLPGAVAAARWAAHVKAPPSPSSRARTSRSPAKSCSTQAARFFRASGVGSTDA